MDLAPILERLLAREDLNESLATQLMQGMLSGESSPEQVAGCLIALRMKGVKGSELAAFAQVLRDGAVPVPGCPEDLVDTCGTGGGAASFNLSTGAAIIAAAAGVKIAKHGNRAVTSTCGSADVLEELGVKIAGEPEEASRQLSETGLCFFYAPDYHPGMKHVGPIRRSLAVRTVFNMIGPLVNPARAKTQLIGVYETGLIEPMADALERLGGKGMVVTGMDGLDEVSPTAPTYAHTVDPDKEHFTRLTPAAFGIEPGDVDLEPGSTIAENAHILRSALDGSDLRRTKALVPNVAVTLWLTGKVASLKDGASLAMETVSSGQAIQKLNQWIDVSRA